MHTHARSEYNAKPRVSAHGTLNNGMEIGKVREPKSFFPFRFRFFPLVSARVQFVSSSVGRARKKEEGIFLAFHSSFHVNRLSVVVVASWRDTIIALARLESCTCIFCHTFH